MKKNKMSLLLIIIFIGIGFAYLSTNLSINGDGILSKAIWSVHFDNVKVVSISDNGTFDSSLDDNKTSMTFDVYLKRPGDKIEFSVDIVNDGTIDALLQTHNMSLVNNQFEHLVNYNIEYSDNYDINNGDLLMKGFREQLLITVEYNRDISEDDLLLDNVEFNFNLDLDYGQASKNVKLREMSTNHFLAMQSNNNEIDFTKTAPISSANLNGSGVNLYGSSDVEYPIYYYRGNVTNNNVVFADKCWQIIRTTSTGGVKLIYNGEYSETNKCNNIGIDRTNGNQDTRYVWAGKDLNNSGYMKGTNYDYYSFSYNGETSYFDLENTYGNDVTYENGTYTLIDTITTVENERDNNISKIANGHHYLCITEECTFVIYFFQFANSNAYYLILQDGEKIEDALVNMNGNNNEEWFKRDTDIWFVNNLSDYTSAIEDTVYCGDRSVTSGGLLKDASAITEVRYGGYDRMRAGTPSLDCREVDSYTVSSDIGNGALTYPIGHISSDEVMLAGYVLSNNSSDNYLYIGNDEFWIMNEFKFYTERNNAVKIGKKNLTILSAGYNGYMRPVISLNKNVYFGRGRGTKDDPLFALYE